MASIPALAAPSSCWAVPPLPPTAPSSSPLRYTGNAPWPGIMWPPSIAIRPRNTGDMALSVSSPLARPKHAAATALAREIGGVRQEAPSVRNMAIKSPRGSTTDTLILAPIAITLAFAAARICSASASVKDAIGCPPCVCVDRTDAVRRHPEVELQILRQHPVDNVTDAHIIYP